MKLIFIRHGDPCRDTFSISEKGIEEVKLLGNFFTKYKIKEILSATSTRAEETVDHFIQPNNKIPIKSFKWLNEFKHKIILPNGKEQFPWEIPLDFWCGNKKVLNKMYTEGNIMNYAKEIWCELDKFLESKGYSREKARYMVTHGNEDCFVFITHFATISVILAYLLNIPLVIMLHAFWQAPSAYTTLITEEMEKGKVIFRCVGYGETMHLANNENLMSYYGLQQEVSNKNGGN